TNEAKLADFGLAAPVAVTRQQHNGARSVEGTLAYISPEQTGRMNRGVDERSDLYSLGVTFYQMLTGSVPFSGHDTLEWIHAHIAKSPRPPTEVVPDVPLQLSQLVLKLLSKQPEDRYQSATGLLADLERCAAEFSSSRRVEPFALGVKDVSREFQLSRRLYGREREVAELVASFERVVATESPHLLLLSGYAGVGKTALVSELHKPVVAERGLFLAGKFDQLRRNVSYSALAHALRELVAQLLTESADEVDRWRSDILAAVGGAAGVLTEVVPELELIIGPQSPPAALGPGEAQNRFNLVFRSFLQLLANRGRPVVLVLDDLQWADRASLDLFEYIWPAVHGPMLAILAYRDNEVDAAHPLTAAITRIRAAGASVDELRIAPLDGASVTALIADTLRAPLEQCGELARIVMTKTEGNPFFVNEFLRTLHIDGLLRFDVAARSWGYSATEIAARQITDNVVELLIDRLRGLPAATQRALELAACMGYAFDLETLAVVSETSADDAAAALAPAQRSGIVIDDGDGATAGGEYRFVHDRLQQAAYALIAPEGKAQAHLTIGRLLHRRFAGAIESKLFDIVDQLDAAASLVADPSEREQLVQLNLAAGRRAKATTAYQQAQRYLATAVSLLPSDAWGCRHRQAFDLHIELAECEFLSGNLPESSRLFETLLAHAADDLDRGRVLYLQMKLFQVAGQLDAAIDVALRSFALFGLATPPTAEAARLAVGEELARARALVGDRAIAELLDQPLMTDPEAIMIASLLEASGPPVY
ncbi:MAG: AAA family ATPase, partial [Myxococcales bacterium]|nr:AAA family ATPase [Myxococcales bacterium]